MNPDSAPGSDGRPERGKKPDGSAPGKPEPRRGGTVLGQTRWSLILAARGDGPEAEQAIRELLVRYRPVYEGEIRRRLCNHDPENAVAAFASKRFLDLVRNKADPSRGRFRVLLRTAVRNFIHETLRAAHAAIRYPGTPVAPFDTAAAEVTPAEGGTVNAADRAFDLEVARQAFRRAFEATREELLRNGINRGEDEP